MAKIKTTKKAGSTDMTAMCDVAFLLLTFFILTATAKPPVVMPVDTPKSTVQTKLPEKDLATLTVGNDKVFFDVKGKNVRIKTLELMGEKYDVTFSEEDKQSFAAMESFGVPVQSLKQILEMDNNERKKVVQPGIPMDSLDNQLADWVQNARLANMELEEADLFIAIKGDAKEEYPVIRKVMDVLQDQKINSFSLVTGLRTKDF